MRTFVRRSIKAFLAASLLAIPLGFTPSSIFGHITSVHASCVITFPHDDGTVNVALNYDFCSHQASVDASLDYGSNSNDQPRAILYQHNSDGSYTALADTYNSFSGWGNHTTSTGYQNIQCNTLTYHGDGDDMGFTGRFAFLAHGPVHAPDGYDANLPC